MTGSYQNAAASVSMPRVEERASPGEGVLLMAGAVCIAGRLRQPSAVSSNDNVVVGKQLFVAKCGACHTLARAGTQGTVGPNLDAAFRQSLSEGFERSVVHGVVADQIQFPGRTSQMPAHLVTGDNVDDVAAYVAASVDQRGQDTGLLATAVKAAGRRQASVESNGELQIDADPSGQLAYVTDKATATAGPVSGQDGQPVLRRARHRSGGQRCRGQGRGRRQGRHVAVHRRQPPQHLLFCTLPGHRAAGMEGTLTVK